MPAFAQPGGELRDILPKTQAYTVFDRHSSACTRIKKHASSYFQEAKKSSQMAISSWNKMICHLSIKSIYIILIEYFYYCIHSRTAGSEKYTKVKAHGAIHYFCSSEGNSFSQQICKRNKIHIRNTSKYTSNCLCVSKTGITTE